MAAARTTSTPDQTTAARTPSARGGADDSSSERSAKWHRRREQIVDRSASVMAERGFHATSTIELCEANELGKGALYYYIGSKEELLVAIHDRVMDEVLAGAARVTAEGGTPSEQLAGLGADLLDIITRYPDHVWVFLHDFPALTGDNATQFRTRRREYEAVVEAVIEAGVATGEFRSLDPRLTARAFLGMHNYSYLWMRSGGELSSAEIADRFADLFLQGIAR